MPSAINGHVRLSTIPETYGQVAGYYVWMYNLDSQLNFANDDSLYKLGLWLCCKVLTCEAKRTKVLQILATCGFSEEVLYAEWQAQLEAQTKPVPRQQKNKGKAAVEEILCLWKSWDTLCEKVGYLRELIIDTSTLTWDVATYELELLSAKDSLMKLEGRVAKKEKALGALSDQAICHLLNSTYLNKRMNALALLMHIQECLHSQKFELDCLEQSYRKQRSEQQINEHTQDSVKRCKPGIAALAPHNAIPPKLIEMDHLFSLDMDNNIWLDIRLGYDEDKDGPPPLWLLSDGVHCGIHALLDRDQCNKEWRQLVVERNAMQQWFSEEWKVVHMVLDTSSRDICYHLNILKDQLLRLYVVWERAIVGVPSEVDLPAWGPSQEDIQHARGDYFLGTGVDLVEEDMFDMEFEVEADELLIEHLDSL
ncbi:hypothetical protein GYMLUDRAFT_252449 [Collybiopsis luxurians FD-317 M1]|uniref:Uncharacterized protein n=1 Tax=Collybiopsis luxurians FD-317 M1 TaxID=944289 RepID=A0A0D0ALJ1_9AGAR|nr:hypothetical protein GYMLUDRAFT_252449 [Collybiopsis luxurians FD-317 M1]